MVCPAVFRPRAGFWISLMLAAAGTLAVIRVQWEAVGAPILAVLLFGGAAAVLMLRDSPRWGRFYC